MRFYAFFLLAMTCLLQAVAPETARAEKDPDGILARRVGVWNAKVTMKVPVQKTFDGQEKIGWVLKHNYLMGKGFYDDKGDGNKTEVLNMMAYNEADKSYYIWEFMANNKVQQTPAIGTWDAKKEQMTLIADLGDEGTGEGTWKFENDGTFTWTYQIKNQQGKVVFSVEGTQVKTKKTTAAKKNPTN